MFSVLTTRVVIEVNTFSSSGNAFGRLRYAVRNENEKTFQDTSENFLFETVVGV